MARDQFIIQDLLWMVTEPVGVPVYDFDFRSYFQCRTPYQSPEQMPGVARIGAISDYDALFLKCSDIGIDLVHSPEDHRRCASLPLWYPLIEKDTPRSCWFSYIPSFEEIEAEFTLPVFVKGDRQTSRHQAAASIIRNRKDFDIAAEIFQTDPILHWQDFVCREFVELRAVGGVINGKISASYEFRTFWWRGEFVGAGRYWFEANDYSWNDFERDEALEVARHAADVLECTFLVIDIAQTIEGSWIIIECNDGMESGYAGASPLAVWQNIIDREMKR